VLDGTDTPNFYHPSFEVGGNLSQGQYCNDPIDDRMVKFKIEVATDNEGKLLPYLNIVCKLKSRIGEELYLSYGTEYWMKQANRYKLSLASRTDMKSNNKSAWKRNSALYNIK